MGGEWYGYGFYNLLSGTIILSLLTIISCGLFIKYFKKQNALSLTSCVLFIFFTLLTLKSRRYIEYFGPITILFVALQFNFLLTKKNILRFYQTLKASWSYKIIIGFLIIFLALIIPIIIIKDCQTNKKDLSRGLAFNKFQPAMTWLAQNSPEGATVIQSDWDEWPILFYHNTHNYYLVGLDPTFMYNYNQDLYWKWVNISIGKTRDNLAEQVTQDFKAQYVFLETDHKAMDTNFMVNPYFHLIYEDTEAKIYQYRK